MSDCSRSLVFMDSGIGGIPYLRWVRERRPDWDYFYIADNAFFPYGGRSPGELTNRLKKLTSLAIDRYSPDIIILACNTASVTALTDLRKEFTLPFVGVVPAVKPAAEKCSCGKIGVLATKGTVEGSYLQELIEKFADHRDAVEPLAAPDLVQFVENELAEASEKRIFDVISPYLTEAEKRGWTYMVLGCTHFLFLKPWLEKWKPPGLSVLDSTEGVGNRVLSLLECPEDATAGEAYSDAGVTRFHLTNPDVSVEKYVKFVQAEAMELHYLEDLH